MTLPDSIQWIVIGVVIALTLILVRWLFRADKNDEFNLALAKYRKLARSQSKSSLEFLDSAFDTISSLQMVLDHNRNAGDTYVVLAGAYLVMAGKFPKNGIYTLGFRLASAVMMYWRDNPQMYTRNKPEAAALQKMIETQYRRMLVGQFQPSSSNRTIIESIFNANYSPTFTEATESANLGNIQTEALAWLDLQTAANNMELGRFPQAIIACNNAIIRVPTMADGYFMRAHAYFAADDMVRGLKDLDVFESLEAPNQYSISSRSSAEFRLQEKNAE